MEADDVEIHNRRLGPAVSDNAVVVPIPEYYLVFTGGSSGAIAFYIGKFNAAIGVHNPLDAICGSRCRKPDQYGKQGQSGVSEA